MERNHIYGAPGGEGTVDLFSEAGKRNISTTFFISSYFSPTFPVIACDSRHCVKLNVKMQPPKACRWGNVPPLLPPCYATELDHFNIWHGKYLQSILQKLRETACNCNIVSAVQDLQDKSERNQATITLRFYLHYNVVKNEHIAFKIRRFLVTRGLVDSHCGWR